MIERRKFLSGALCLASPALWASSNQPTAVNSTPSDKRFELPTSPLLRKTIPASGARLPVVGIGTNRYGASKDPKVIAGLAEVLNSFAKVGDGMIDTAPQYRGSERMLGELIARNNLTERFFLASKCDEFGAPATQMQIANSASLLGQQRLDLVAVHNLTNWQTQLPILRELQQQKRIKHIGITTANPPQYAEMEKIMRSQHLDFVQLNYSLLERAAEQRLLPLAADKGLAVVVNLPFARRAFFQAAKGHKLPDWAADIGITSWAQYALKYIVSHPAVTCAIPGTRKLKHLNDNLAAATGEFATAQQRKLMEQYFEQL